MKLTQRAQGNLFDRVTGKAKPKLAHPTAKAFRIVDWAQALDPVTDPETVSISDAELFLAASFFGNELVVLRDVVFPTLLTGLTRSDVIRLAIGSSNRAVALSRRQLARQLAAGPKGEAGHVSALVETQLTTAHGTMAVNDISTAVIDALPHWFAQAKERPETVQPPDESTGSLMQLHARAETFITLERAIRDLWQQVLWEPWRLDPTASTLYPVDRQQAAAWIAWQHRQDSLTAQLSQFDSLIGLRHHDKPPVLKRVARSARRQNGRIKIEMRYPTEQQRDELYKLMEAVAESYLGPFLDVALPSKSVTVRDVVKGWLLLRTVADALVVGLDSMEFDKRSDLKALCFEMPEATIQGLIQDALGLDSGASGEIAALLTCDPLDLKDVFANEVWHRPLVGVPGSTLVAVATSVLQSANMILVLERLFQATGLAKQVETKSLGIAYEKTVRKALADAIAGNKLLTDAAVAPSAIERKVEGDEEIDIVIRLGKLIVVGEVKCFVGPTDPVDRFNHIDRLHDAAKQAERKAEWLRQNPEALRKSLADSSLHNASLTFVPLVILNHGAGLGLKLGEALVTDVHWLSIILGGEYGSGGEKDNRIGVYTQRFRTLYGSIADLESNFANLFLKPPGLEKFKSAIVWETFDLPTAAGGVLKVERALLSNERMVAAERRS